MVRRRDERREAPDGDGGGGEGSSGDFLLSPCGGCSGGLEAIFRQAVCAMSVTDGDGLWLYRCVLREIRTRLCRTHDGLAGLRIAVAANIAIFA